MGCGALCADCSWEDHLAGMAHTGGTADTWEPHEDTSACCRAALADRPHTPPSDNAQ